MYQTSFFDRIDPDAHGFRAVICGGWWVAVGKTEREAVRRVIEQYQKEMEGLWA